ncbi:MAG: DinB family protein [Armatimonadetes bacterium]|nr:DinB family protein [Armatimonadota bacterium]
MDIKDALKGQYLAAFRMLRECVTVCPPEMWLSGQPPREFWKIAYHAVFYGHLYMGQGVDVFKPFRLHEDAAHDLHKEHESPAKPLAQEEVLEYIDEVMASINSTVDGLDLDTEDPGFPWYKNINKLEHEVLSIRHIQGHVGQLSELLMAKGIDTSWISRRA